MIGSVPITHCEMGTCLMRCCSGGRSGSSKKLSTWWQPSPFLCALLVDHNCFHVVGIHLWIILSYIRESLQYFVNRHDHGNSITQSLLVISGQRSIPQAFPTLCDPMDCCKSGFCVHHQCPELTQIHIHQVSDAIHPPYPLLSPSPLAFNFPIIRVFINESVLRIGSQISEFQLQHKFFQWIFRTYFL